MNDVEKHLERIKQIKYLSNKDSSSRGDWMRIGKWYFDPKEIVAVELSAHSVQSNSTRVQIYLKNGTKIEADFHEARAFWLGFTGELLEGYSGIDTPEQ